MDKECGTVGKIIPFVNQNKCEAKGPCVEVCPYNVFEIRPIETTDFEQLSLIGKLKNKIHGGKVSYVVNSDTCHACGLCIKACPEGAIKLVRTQD